MTAAAAADDVEFRGEILMRYLTPIFASLGAFATACAGAADLDPVRIPTTATSEVRQIVEKGWPKVEAACPGFQRFKADLTFKGIEDNLAFAPAHAKRVDVVYQVKPDPKVIPPEFRAFGHTCYFSISPDLKTLYVSKRPCASICKGSEQNDPLTSALR